MRHFITLAACALSLCVGAAQAEIVSTGTSYPGSAPISHSELDVLSLVQFGIGNLPPIDEGSRYAIRGVRARVDLDHAWASDVEATLSFNDRTVGLIYDAARAAEFASGDGYEYWFQAGGDELPSLGTIPSGNYMPTVNSPNMPSDLALFNGLDPTGSWYLHISDDTLPDDGVFYGWELELDVEAVESTPEPSGFALLCLLGVPMFRRR